MRTAAATRTPASRSSERRLAQVCTRVLPLRRRNSCAAPARAACCAEAHRRRAFARVCSLKPTCCAGPPDAPATQRSAPLTVVSANYVVRATWAKGFVVDVTVVVDCLNSGRKNRFGVDGFRMSFELPDGATVAKAWNGTLDQDGSVCTVCNPRFCKPVDRGQAVLYCGFEARLDMEQACRSPTLPTTLEVNGQVCRVTGCFARDLADCRNDASDDDDDDDLDARRPEASENETEDSESEARPSRQRCASAPPVFCHSFGLATPRGHDEHADNTVCAESGRASWVDDDENQSIAETVRGRGRGDSYTLDGSREQGSMSNDHAVLTPPLSSFSSRSETPGCQSATGTSLESLQCVPSVPRKRKFFEEDETDHTVLCSESSKATSSAHESGNASSCALYPRTLQIDYYRRSKALKKRKYLHMDYLDTHFRSREEVILDSVLDDPSKPIVMEPNMFPYDTPAGVTHWTLWSRKWLQEEEVEAFVDGWLAENLPEALEWNHDDNMADGLSINLFHLHVYVRCPA